MHLAVLQGLLQHAPHHPSHQPTSASSTAMQRKSSAQASAEQRLAHSRLSESATGCCTGGQCSSLASHVLNSAGTTANTPIARCTHDVSGSQCSTVAALFGTHRCVAGLPLVIAAALRLLGLAGQEGIVVQEAPPLDVTHCLAGVWGARGWVTLRADVQQPHCWQARSSGHVARLAAPAYCLTVTVVSLADPGMTLASDAG